MKALNEGKEVEIYRARISQNPRPESERLIGQKPNPEQILKDLRDNKGVEAAFGLPNGPNSGLSIKIIE